MNITVTKRARGWHANTRVELAEPHVLEISTFKNDRGLVSVAQRFKVDRGMKSFELFGDFNVTLMVSDNRCTEKSVRTQHSQALTRMDAILEECAAFYAKKAS